VSKYVPAFIRMLINFAHTRILSDGTVPGQALSGTK
jgi:hypothetical protein